MEKILKEIIEGEKAVNKNIKEHNGYYFPNNKGIGSKRYVIKRIDLLREQLLEIKKKLM